MDAIKLLAQDYQQRLSAQGIPTDPGSRTADQQNTAALDFWAAQSEFLVQIGSLAQSAVEVK